MDIAFPRIEPSVAEASFRYGSGRSLPVARIELGGVPRGAAIVLCDTGALERDAAGFMNGLAEHGYESVAVDLSPTGGDPTGTTDRDLVSDVAVLLGRLGERGWSPVQVGLVGYGPDERPLAGPVPGEDGLYVLGGYNGTGNLNGFVAGRIVAELIARGSAPDADLYDTGRIS